MPWVDGSLMQAIHDYHFGNGCPAEKVAILVIDEQPLTAKEIAALITDETNHRTFARSQPPPATKEMQWAIPIILQVQRTMGGHLSAYTPPQPARLFMQLKQAYSLGYGNERLTPTEMEQDLRLIAKGRVLEFCRKIVRRKDETQFFEAEVLALAGRLQIPTWLIELNQSWRTSAPTLTCPSHVGLRVRVNARRLSKAGFNAFQDTTLHHDLQAANIKRVVVMGREANCCVKETVIGGPVRRNSTTMIAGATGHGYTVMTSLQVIAGRAPSWVHAEGVEFYTRL